MDAGARLRKPRELMMTDQKKRRTSFLLIQTKKLKRREKDSSKQARAWQRKRTSP